MPFDSISPLLSMTLQATGNNPTSWGDKINSGIVTQLENAIAGRTVINSDGITTLTEAQRINGIIEVQGTNFTQVTLTMPSGTNKIWLINNLLVNPLRDLSVVAPAGISGSNLSVSVPLGMHTVTVSNFAMYCK